ncbi:AsnC family protein, partial [Frankia sp. Cppng1_Ct_nod]|uniref:AsnC family protein n=1 Tax=Frankia sp. Cppng1_Ct_nod TaxID=2897162 RepID=UPI002025647A
QQSLDAGFPPPLLEEIGIRFRVTLFTTRVAAPTMDETDQAILNALTEDGALASEVAAAIGLSTRATRTRLPGSSNADSSGRSAPAPATRDAAITPRPERRLHPTNERSPTGHHSHLPTIDDVRRSHRARVRGAGTLPRPA